MNTIEVADWILVYMLGILAVAFTTLLGIGIINLIKEIKHGYKG